MKTWQMYQAESVALASRVAKNPGGLGGRVMWCRGKRLPPPNASATEFRIGPAFIGREPPPAAQYSLGPPNHPRSCAPEATPLFFQLDS